MQSSLSLPVGPLAVTPDGNWLLVGTSNAIRSIEVRSARLCSGVELEATPDEIAITPDGLAVYATMPARLFVSDIKALQCS